MPKLSEALTTLTVGGKKFQNPEWWSSKHKLTREVKRENSTKEIIQRLTPRIGGQLEVVTLEKQPPADVYVDKCKLCLIAKITKNLHLGALSTAKQTLYL